MEMLTLAIRQLLLFAHLLIFALAFAAIVREDLDLLTTRRLNAEQLKRTAHLIMALLGLLWMTGVSLVLLDVGLDWVLLASKPKLLTKLAVVCVLTANGVLLHYVAFPMLTTPQRWPRRAAAICSVLGAISSVSWLYAAFMGTARLIAPKMTLHGFVTLYSAVLVGGLTVAWVLVRPRLVGLLTPQSSPDSVPAQQTGALAMASKA